MLSCKLPQYIRISAYYYLVMLGLSALFRLVLLLLEHTQLSAIPEGDVLGLIIASFSRGMRFDTVIICYGIILPATTVFLTEKSLLPRCAGRWFAGIALILAFSFTLAVYCLDLAYFVYNGNRITMSIFQWNDNPAIILSLIYQDPYYSVLTAGFLFLAVLFGIFSWKYLLRQMQGSTYLLPVYVQIWLGVVFLFLLVSGLRGSMFKGPVREGDATICQYQFPNQLALNPAFVLYRDMRNSVNLMDDSTAVRLARQFLQSGDLPVSPIARRIIGSTSPQKFNVVLVLMESMTAENMAYFGNARQLTPRLDSLAKQSLFFENAYSSGIHTNNGIFTSLFSYPSFWRLRPLSAVRINEFSGFSGVLGQHGYRSTFLTTQDASFDNLSQFLPRNHFDSLISEADYPKEQIVNTFGVPDHVQFDKSIHYFNQQWADSTPFFGCILTASNHPPIVIPREHGFEPRNSEAELGVIEYADWSIGRFMDMAAQTDWYSHTIFVFVADHGAKTYASPYDIRLAFNHIPMIIHCPALVPHPTVYSAPAGQIDVFPTVMGLMGLPYINNTFGCDLLSDTRPYIFFSADDKMACIDRDYVYVFRKTKSESLYRYRCGDLTDYINLLPERADSMRTYCKANVQAAQWCITADMTGLSED